MTSRELLLTWDKDPFLSAIAAALLIFYAVFLRGQRGGRMWLFFASALTLVLALASPIAVLARGYLFGAHMLQHILLVLVVPPLALLAIPVKTEGVASTELPTLRAAISWLLGVGAMWLWHAPTLCNAASQSSAIAHLQTASLLAMGAAFWWPVVGPRSADRFTPYFGIGYLFTACIACTVLGVIVTFSPVEVCSVYAHPVDRLGVLPLLRDSWGISAKTDQQIGGLLMWVPGCAIYAGSILAMYARTMRESADVGAPKETT